MAGHRVRAGAAPQRARREKATGKPESGRRTAVPADPEQPPAPTTREMMVMAGNRPHETILHEFTLEDFGLDVPRVIHCDHP